MVRENRQQADVVDRAEQQLSKKRLKFSLIPLTIMARTQRAAFYFQAQSSRMAKSCGLNGREFLVLTALWRSEPPFSLHPMHLLEEYFIPAATLTRQLDRLSAMGLVRRTVDPKDRRGIQIRLTAKGHRLMDHAMRQLARDQPEYKALQEVGERDLNSLNRLLRKVLLRLEQPDDSPSDRRRRDDSKLGL